MFYYNTIKFSSLTSKLSAVGRNIFHAENWILQTGVDTHTENKRGVERERTQL